MLEMIPFGIWDGKDVLEIGCGTGIDSVEFARNGAKVTSIDFADESVKRTKETYHEAGLIGTVLLRPANATGLPGSSFDLIYSYGVLHYISAVDRVLEEIARLIKPEGQGIFMVYNKDSLLNAYSILFLHRGEGSEQELAIRYSERNPGNPYTKLYSAAEATELFSKYFEEVRIETVFTVIDTPAQRKLKVESSTELGWHHLIFCRRPIKDGSKSLQS
jgi:ubiquinone/menaquinone biosynthesis C-methylase UbiE